MDQAQKFIQQYNLLLDQIAKVNPTRLFWATDFASKNRFSCPLPDCLQIVAQGQNNFKPDFPNVRPKRIFGVFYHAVTLAWRMLQAKTLVKRIDLNQQYTVIKTFIYDHSFNDQGEFKDVFLGPLTTHEQSKGPVLIYAYILGHYQNCLKKMSAADVLIVPVEAFLTFGDLWQAVWEMFTVDIKFPAKLDFAGQDVRAMVKSYFDNSFKGVQLRQFIQFWTTRQLATQVKIKCFYMTYENYPWERMTIQALRAQNPSIDIIGIQHTVVPQAFLNYFTSHSEKENHLLPNRVFTTGPATADIIHKYSSSDLDVRGGCALRFTHMHQMKVAERRTVKNILIALEASMKTIPMVKYVLDQVQGNADYEILIRTHPLLPWDAIASEGKIKTQDHMRFSSHSLKDDMEWADVVIYWSTTVSMEALMIGKPVIHFDLGTTLSFDPLFECPHLKWTINSTSDLISILKHIDALTATDFQFQYKTAQQYLNTYFAPVTSQAISLLAQ